MPCNDWSGVSDTVSGRAYDTARKTSEKYREQCMRVEAMLCAILSVHESLGTLGIHLIHVDWNEAGVTEAEFEAWWEDHKAKDQARKEAEKRVAEFHVREAEAREVRERIRTEALSKLTPEERQALGVV